MTWFLHQRHNLSAQREPHNQCKRINYIIVQPKWIWPRLPLGPSQGLSDRKPSTSCYSSFQFLRKQYAKPDEDLISQRCSKCGGTGKCSCADCGGRGRLSRAGYNKRNRVDKTRVVGSKWTAMKETMGWRHFRVIQCRKGASAVAFVQMQASCDNATQLWTNASNLKDRDLWAAGWLQKSEMEDPAGAMAGGVTCRACSGTGSTPCPVCDATGAVLLPPSGLGNPSDSAAGAGAVAFTSSSNIGGGGEAISDVELSNISLHSSRAQDVAGAGDIAGIDGEGVAGGADDTGRSLGPGRVTGVAG